MSYLHHYIGLMGNLLVLIAIPLLFVRQPRVGRKPITIVIFLMMGLAVLPVDNTTILVYMRAVIADLSITSLVLLCLFIATAYNGQQFVNQASRQRLHAGILLGALILYPLGLGLTYHDTYAWGYGSITLLFLIVACAAYLIWRNDRLVLGILLAGTLAYLLNILQSDNLWDYLLDPWVVIVTIVIRLSALMKSTMARMRTRQG